MAKFSIVIPLYNKEDKIRQTLMSVINQTYSDFEIVVVDDGSTDKSVSITREIADTRIRIVSKRNGGVSSARNCGINEATSEWIAFLDADDLWAIDKLEQVANVIDTHPEVSWVFSGFNTVKGAMIENRSYAYNGQFTDALDALNGGLDIQTSTVVVKRSYFLQDERLYFPLGISNSEDREVWYRLIFRYPQPYYIGKPLSNYIIDESGKSLNSGNLGNFAFLKLGERLTTDVNLLSLERKKKFQRFLKEFNRIACWRVWTNLGWKSDFEGYVSRLDQVIMTKTATAPINLKRLIFKAVKIANQLR